MNIAAHSRKSHFTDIISLGGSLTAPLGFNGGDANLKRYVGNSPANLVDPTGNEAVPDNELIVVKVSIHDLTKAGVKDEVIKQLVVDVNKIFGPAKVTIEIGKIDHPKPGDVQKALGKDQVLDNEDHKAKPGAKGKTIPSPEPKAILDQFGVTKTPGVVHVGLVSGIKDQKVQDYDKEYPGLTYREGIFGPHSGSFVNLAATPSGAYTLAHELFHLIANTSKHVNVASGNLMEQLIPSPTGPKVPGIKLTKEQMEQLRKGAEIIAGAKKLP